MFTILLLSQSKTSPIAVLHSMLLLFNVFPSIRDTRTLNLTGFFFASSQKKIDNNIDFLRAWEKKNVFTFGAVRKLG